MVLQHPREAKNPLGSARLLSLATGESAVHRVGLSWRSLNHALGGTQEPVDQWAVLYLGTEKGSVPLNPKFPFEVRDRKGKALPKINLRGVVLLDGNWKQSKTLWWRNPWLLKLNRLLLNPAQASRYGSLRKQPRGRCLSTLEAGAETLHALGEEAASDALFLYFEDFVEHARKAKFNSANPAKQPGRTPKPAAPPSASAQ